VRFAKGRERNRAGKEISDGNNDTNEDTWEGRCRKVDRERGRTC